MPNDRESTKKAAAKSSGSASRASKQADDENRKRRAAAPPVDDDDYEDEEEDEDEDEDDEEESKPPARVNRPVVRSDIPTTEAALNTPNSQTLWMLGVISLSTLIMWGFGRAACNLHPPRESRKPRVVSTADLSRDPKNAAIELQQRWAVHKYGSAMELASGPLADELRKNALQCEARTEACEKEQAERAPQIKTVGDLLRRDMTSAIVRVTTYGPGSTQEKYLVTLEPAGEIWKGKSRVKDTGQPLPAAPAPGSADAPSAGNPPSPSPIPVPLNP